MKKITRNSPCWQALWFIAWAWMLLTAGSSAFAGARSVPVLQPAGILFIENNVADYQQLAADASASLEVVVLDAQEDGLRQIADALVGRKNVPAVHLISHGAPGVVDLGSLMLDRNALVQRSADLARIRAALRRDADLLLYGCEVAQGLDGQRLTAMLADATGARVAASTNPTGYLDKGGDWVLERQTGAMRTAALAFPAYRELLQSVAGTVSVNNATNWVNFGATLNDNEGDGGDIPNISYDMFFANSSGVPTGTVATFNNSLGSVGTVLLLDTSPGGQDNQPAYSFIIKSQAGKFKLTSFLIQDYYGMNSNYTATPYLNGVPRGTPFNFTIPQSGGYASTVTLPAQFGSVTEVRITSDGGNFPQSGNNNIWQGFNNFVFANPVYSTNANLSALSLSSGTLSPVFAANTTSYTASVGNATTSITVTPTVSDTGRATVTVNGLPVASGAASGAIALGVGSNVIATVVTAEDGSTTKTYTTTVTRAAPPSSNANLSSLALSTGTLSPAFASGTTSYTASVPFNTVSLTVTPTVADATASVTVNGVGTTSGNASGAIALAVGNNTITTLVTAQDGTTKTYTTTVTRSAASGNAQLSALSLSSGTLAPAFASGTTSYTAGVSNATTSITVTPTVADATGSVTVNGVSTASGNASGAIALAVGSNTITVTVTAQNGTPLSYTITVTRAASANANLSALSLSSGTLAPVFAAGITSYTASVSNATTSITVTPTVADGGASVTVNGVAASSGNASGAIALAVGTNTITTVVTAADGATTRTYTVTVTRAASSNNNLSALSLSSGSLTPAFNQAATSYTAAIGAGVSSIRVTPTVADGSASITVNGSAIASGSPSGAIAMNGGSNTVSVVVTAQNSATKTYTVTITRALPSSTADLSALSLSSGTLSPAFSGGTTSYTASVGNATTSLTVTPTVVDATASITVNGVTTTSGNASGAIALNVGSNTIITAVTAQDGTTVKTYTVTVTRAGSGDANLSALVVSGGSIAPAFAAGTTGYTMSIAAATASVTVTPTVNDPSATVTVNGVSVASGTASGAIAMNVGANTITVVVTAQNSTTRTYTVSVTRARPTTATGTVPGGGGAVNASLAGPAGCGFDRADFIPLAGAAASPPAGSVSGYTFNQGLFDVVVGGCPNGAAVTVTLTYPQALPPGAVYMKYGPTAGQNAPHWYAFAGATITGNTVTLVLTDGGLGDDDLTANGTIADPGGVALAVVGGGGGAVGIPTLSQWGVLLLSLLVAAAAGLNAWRNQRAAQRPWGRG